MHRQIESLWETDFGNATSVLDVPSSREDRIAFKLMKQSVKQEDKHYILSLPWRPNVILPCDNRGVAERRLASLKKRFLNDKALHQKYTDVMELYLKKEHAQKIPLHEVNTNATKWYLPHHPVLNPQKPSKLRVVFDCAAKSKGVSLNVALMQGPDLVNSLIGVLIRFRKEQVAITADIESMFHQVRVDPLHCHALRFLWWPQGDLSAPPEVHQMMVHLFGATSSPSCAAFSLRQTAHDYGSEFDPDISNVVHHNFYVDDCLCSVSSVKDGLKIVTQLLQLLQKGGFHLTKWSFNNSSVLQAVPSPERSTLLLNLDLDNNSIERVLGIRWNIKKDVFEFRVNIPPHSLTRRGILSTLSSLFDPSGFVSPIILNPKILLQNLCKQGLNWDDDISDTEAVQWQAWLQTLTQLQKFTVSRCYKSADFGKIISYELHHFSDASANAYGACSYLRVVDDHGSSPRYLLKLKPILVDGVLRVGGRLDKAPVDFSVRHPVILPSDSHFTALLILHHHQLVGHSGMGHTWASLRQSYWIVKGSVTVRRVIGNCVFCKKRNAPVGQQLMADLLLGRLQVNEPLVPVTFDPDDESLTPNHLLLSRGSVNLPPGLFDKRDSYARRRWAQAQYLANEFWRRWVREFLPNITYRQKWQQGRRNLKLEDIVLIVDDSLLRSKRTIGRVVETFADKHGLVRTVNVKTSTTVLKRPISKLCLILNSDEV